MWLLLLSRCDRNGVTITVAVVSSVSSIVAYFHFRIIVIVVVVGIVQFRRMDLYGILTGLLRGPTRRRHHPPYQIINVSVVWMMAVLIVVVIVVITITKTTTPVVQIADGFGDLPFGIVLELDGKFLLHVDRQRVLQVVPFHTSIGAVKILAHVGPQILCLIIGFSAAPPALDGRPQRRPRPQTRRDAGPEQDRLLRLLRLLPLRLGLLMSLSLRLRLLWLSSRLRWLLLRRR